MIPVLEGEKILFDAKLVLMTGKGREGDDD